MGSNKSGNKKKGAWKYALVISIGTFFLASFVSLGSQFILDELSVIYVAFLLLLGVITVGIVFDIIGVAVAVADEVPFHARASKRIKGAKMSLKLIRNADRVANICNDVVGDVCGTVSGGLGTAIVFNMLTSEGTTEGLLLSTVMGGFVAALTVGGKALSKTYAINQADNIIEKAGIFLSWFSK